MPLFDRYINVKVGKPGSETGIGIDGLRVVFDVKKSIKGGNTANVDIYNLSESSRNKIREIDDVIIVEAGYRDEVSDTGATVDKTVFIGYVARITIERTGPDIITRIEANDGSKTLRQKKLSLSYKSGTSANDIFKDVAKKMGVPQKISNVLLEKLNSKAKQYKNGYAFVGQVDEVLDKISKQLYLDWLILNNQLKVVEKDGTDDTPIVYLSSESGLIDSPVRRDDLEDALDKSNKKVGWDVRSLLRPSIEPAGRISIKSKYITSVKSVFKVETVRHVGDNFGGDFMTITTVSDT